MPFSPYRFGYPAIDVTFSKEQLPVTAGKSNQTKIIWGEYDGTGDSIYLTFNEYADRFIYDVDFYKPEKRIVGQSPATARESDALAVFYKNCYFTESYFSGFEKKYQRMDWRSLRLVFKLTDKRFYLLGIIHDEWTI